MANAVQFPGDNADPKSLPRMAKRFIKWMTTMNYSEGTIRVRTLQLRAFLAWCDERNYRRPRRVTKRVLDRYVRHVSRAKRSRSRRRMTTSAQHGRLVAVRTFFRWMSRKRHISHNPASEMDLPKMEHRLPRKVLTHAEVERVLTVPDIDTPLGIRDRAILETLYSTGIRRAELVVIRVDELDVARGLLFVNQGKGKKDRVIPIGGRALHWIQRYLDGVRPSLRRRRIRHHLFLSRSGNPLSPTGLSIIVRKHLNAAGVKSRGACHMFRHSMATSMLENGADIRFIQEMLGHADLKTTQIYTHINPSRLKQVHAATHPARLAG